MPFLKKQRLFTMGLLVLAIVVLPATIYVFQQRQETRSRAEKTVVLSFDPTASASAPMQIPAGTTFTLDVYLDPGANKVSYIKSEIDYDASKFELAGGFIPNQEVFSQVVESPTPTAGKVITTLSVGSDFSKAVAAKTKIGTIALRALNTVPPDGSSIITFGPGSQALSVTGNSSFDENVIANTIPTTIKFNKPSLTCGTSPTDVELVMDRSGSMSDPAGSSGTKLSNAKTAANNFVDILSKNTQSTAGLVTFESTAATNVSLTNNFSSVKSQINAITTAGGTCIECGINKANSDIANKKRAKIKNIVVLLTDGRANAIEGNSKSVSEATADQKALDAATAGHNANGTIFFTIGLGTDVNSDFLTQLAENTGGNYYYSPTTDQLNGIYQQISEILANGNVSGTVYNDLNGNGQMDTNEQGISGALLQLFGPSQNPQAITTDSNGTYAFTNLCDGSYTVRQVLPSGWKQTYPVSPKDYAVAIINGNAASDKDFGDQKGSRCSDGIDNDGNGFIDAKDSTCHTDGDPGNPASYDPNIDGERGGNTCSDSKDNNGNGKIDGADPICHVDGDPQKPYDPGLPEGTTDTKLVCSPNFATLQADKNNTLSVSLKTETGAPVTGKSITWTTTSTNIDINPDSALTDTNGSASTSATISLNTKTPFTASVSAKFAGDTKNGPSACVVQASYTPSATEATLSINVLMHGIGASGDNANPTASSLSNKNPLRTERQAIVSLFDTSNNLVASGTGTIVYSSESGSFKGDITTANPVPAGKYSIKVRTDYHLTRLIDGIQTLVVGQKNTLPAIQAVAGDATNDNRLDIVDYNRLLDCYSDLNAAPNCDDAKKLTTDANDDGSVNQFDYNLFLREISTQPGE